MLTKLKVKQDQSFQVPKSLLKMRPGFPVDFNILYILIIYMYSRLVFPRIFFIIELLFYSLQNSLHCKCVSSKSTKYLRGKSLRSFVTEAIR